jgi:iron(III) transport system substrate-binding protein
MNKFSNVMNDSKKVAYCFFGLMYILVLSWPVVCSGAQKSQGPQAGDAALKAGGPSQKSQELAKLIEGAKAEGKVVWWDGLKSDEAAPVIEAFQKKYPFLKVEHTRIHGTDSRERIFREMQAGIVNFDVFDIGGEEVPTFQKAGFLAKYDWAKAFDLKPEQIEPDGYFLNIGSHIFGPGYNTNLLKPVDIPKSWDNLWDPKWTGKLVVDSRPKTFTHLVPAWGEQKVLDYVRKIAAIKPKYRRGQTEAVQLMAAGEFALHSGTQYDSVYNVKLQGGPVEFLPLEPVPITLEDEAIPKAAAHPNGAKLLLGWLATEGQTFYDSVTGRGLPLAGYPSETSRRFGPMKKSLFAGEWIMREEELTGKILKAMGKE